MIVQTCMKTTVISISDGLNVAEAAETFIRHHIGTLPVVNAEGKLVGLLQLRDLLTLVMPDFVHLVENFDFVRDFGALENVVPSPDQVTQPVSHIMRPPLAVKADCGLLRAFALLYKHQVSDLPVVDNENHVIGIISRVDLGTALLRNWFAVAGKGKE